MARTADLKTRDLRNRLERRGIVANFAQAETLRKAELTLQRWAEQECGASTDYFSWAIERDEDTGKPFRCIYYHDGRTQRFPEPDREKGALRRVGAVCAALDIHYYHQTDPRGCALYVSTEPLTDSNYTNGVACCD